MKHKTKVAAFSYLKSLQVQHSKIKDIQYPRFETQKYMTSQMFTNCEVNLLHALRSRSVMSNVISVLSTKKTFPVHLVA